jgi:excinuclease ABC subunit A
LPTGRIVLRGARAHNLRSIDLDIPHNTFAVITGVSGSGKSTLAFDILFAEGQRRFLECMSAYARQFVEQLPKAELDFLSGLPPTVAIEQRVTRGGAKSTVATVTEIAQYLRLLYARVGTARNPATGNALIASTAELLLKRARQICSNAKHPLLLCTPIVRDRKGHHQPLATWAIKHGYEAMRIDGRIVSLGKFKALDRYKTHDIELVLARLGPKAQDGGAPTQEILAEALRLGKGTCLLTGENGKAIEWLSTERSDPITGESFQALEPKHFSWNSPQGWCPACHGHGRIVERFAEEIGIPFSMPSMDKLSDTICPKCNGGRLNATSNAVTLDIGENARLTLPQLLALTPQAVADFLASLKLDTRGHAIAASIIPEVTARLRFLSHVGLGYLALDRSADTLSGGEAQRIRLASQLGSNLSGVLYVLDEPSIGLHPCDNARLIASLKELRDRKNTVVVVEHDEETMRAADLVIDLGPGAGKHGGTLLAVGSIEEIKKHEHSPTARFLRTAIPHPLLGSWRKAPAPKQWLELRDVRFRNIKGIHVRFPLGRLSVVCGVSGSGKSSLVRDLLAPLLEQKINTGARNKKGQPCQLLLPAGSLRQVILVDQHPIGKTPRSTPATYIGAFDLIRNHFASLPEARMRGHGPSFFSFNTGDGRCKTCGGAGRIKLEMNFLPETYVDCDDCSGQRYGAAAAEVCWNGKTIGDVLSMNFEEAANFFAFDKQLGPLLELMGKTGLGYLSLGQSSPTLSGGEAQRLKLASELAKGLPAIHESGSGKKATGNLYILEEPTIGLHQADCKQLIELLHALVVQGHSVIVIEHHLDLIAEADWVVELGPSGGSAGGQLLYQGDIPGLARLSTPTAPFIAQVLAQTHECRRSK